ncbi:Phospholipid-transporting ATPase [Entamoeba marina]
MSPDEIAFCQTSAKNGFELKEKKQDEIEVTINNIMEVFNQVCVVEFSSERKCADNVIKRKLNEKSIEEYNQTLIQTDKFSGEGLRTLFIAKKQFEFNYIKDWLKRYNEAKELIYERETQLTALYEELETDLELIGATAIEDQLQEGVPETIQMLREAGIKIWVITGDKMETAISVGLTSRLFTNEHKLIQFNCKTLEEFEEHLKTNISLCQTSSMPIAIAINENNIDWCIKYQSEFSILAKLSESVLCCRVTPIQKANITVWVKKMTNKKCLTVGDGANDVPMINCGDVGVGIYGKEGNQAAVTSDYAIRKFRHLGKLVLYYGRNSMYRNSTLIKLCFYKNAAFFLMDVWFAFISNFSCQILYDDWIMTLYNTFFTALPPIAIALFDFDLRWETIRNDPRCHQETLKSSDYKIRSYISWYFYGVLQSFLFFIIFYFLIAPSDVTSNNGKVNGFTFSVVSVSSYSIISILVTIAIHTRRNCLFIVLSHLFSIILYFGMYTIVMFIPGLSVYNLSRKGWFFTLGQPIFYLTIVLTISLTTFPQIVTIYFNKHIRPRYCNILQEFVTKEKDGYQQFN